MFDEDEDLQPIDDSALLRPLTSVPLKEQIEDEPEETDDIETEFDPRYRESFIGLLYLGHLKTKVVRYGHSFSLKTPTHRERIEAGVIHKRFVNTISGEIAWAALVVGLYLEAVDDEPLPEPIGPATETYVLERFNWVIDNIKSELITWLFEECLILDSRVAGTLKELQEKSKASG